MEALFIFTHAASVYTCAVAQLYAGLVIERAWVRIPLATISKFGHFRSLHDASVDSAV